MADQDWHAGWTSVCRALGVAPARRKGMEQSEEVWRDMVGEVDSIVGRRQCQEGVVDEVGHGVAPGICRSNQDAGLRGKRLEASWSVVHRRYSAAWRMWGSKERVTGWSVTFPQVPPPPCCIRKQTKQYMVTLPSMVSIQGFAY
jgi:hypothetical protein